MTLAALILRLTFAGVWLAILLGGFEIDSVSSPQAGDTEELLAFTMGPVGLTMRLRER